MVGVPGVITLSDDSRKVGRSDGYNSSLGHTNQTTSTP